MSETGEVGSSPTRSLTIDELREAKGELDRRKHLLTWALRERGFAAARLHDNYYRDPVTHYPVAESPTLPRAEIQFIACLYLDEEHMEPGARVIIMRRYLDSLAHVYRLEKRPYPSLTNNWFAVYEKPLRIELRNS